MLLKRSTAYFHGELAGGSTESWAALDRKFGSVGWEKTGARKGEDIVDLCDVELVNLAAGSTPFFIYCCFRSFETF